MKRELAFALQVQSQLAGSLGRTRASKVHIQSGDLSGVAEVRGRKRLRGSVANESELNCEVGGSREKSEVNVRKVRGRQFNGTAVYRRTRRSKNAADWEEEQKVSVAESIETAVEGKSKCNLVIPCEDESKGDLAEASIKLELRDGNENPTVNEVDSEGVVMAVDKANGVRKCESDEVKSDAIIEVRSDVPVGYLTSALNSTSKVELAECSLSVAPGSGLMDGGENESVLDVEVSGSPDVGASVTPTKKLELKMSKKISMGRTPRTVKELFTTGLLEGYSVFYNGGKKGFALQGMIKDVGILCFCSSCNGSQVVNPCQFEIHACKSYRRAAQYICLENGKSLLEVVKACRSSRLDTLEETIQSVIGKLPEKESIICQNCKGSFLATFAEKVKQLCESCVESNNLEATPADVKQHCEPCLESKNLEATPIDTIDANDRSLEPDLALRRSTRKQCILAQDDNQGSIRDDRSPELVVMPKSPASGSAHILSQRKSQEKTIRKSLKPALAPISSGSAAVPICSRNKSQVRIAQNCSRSASVSKPSASTLMCISSKCNRRGKITKKLPKLVSARKSYRGASVHILSETRRPHKITKKSSKAVLSTRSSKSASQCTSPPQKSKWKITKKDLRLHKLVFEEDGLPDGTEVAYYSNGQKLLEGYKRGLGILCHCCNSEVSASQFEAHAGWASRRKPYSYIYTSNGVSLHEFAISLLKGRKHCAKDNDDLCIICADGGNLLLCDGCPRAFHIECAALPSIPRGKWYCNYCQNMFQREKFVERNANAVAAGRVSGVDSIEQITKRCMRIVKNPEDAEVIACVLCRGYDFSKSGFGPRTVIVCDQCEREYHVGCLKKHKMADLKELPKGTWFCCMDCGKIYSALQNLLVRGEEKIPDSLLDVIKKKHEDKASNAVTDFDVRWRLLSGKIASPETRLLLSKAVAIFHECFDPIVDFATGRDFIPSMVYGRNIRGQDFGGMYCAILTVNSSVVSAGIFRVFGREIAELPLVATSNGNQGKGYFQLLFSCIEKLFAFLNVKSLVLPAADEAESIWTNKFGFDKIPPEQLSKYRKTCWQMLTFKGTSMLQKMVPQCRIIEQNVDVPMESS